MFKWKTGVILLSVLMSQLLISVALGASVAYGVGNNKAPEGLSIWGIDISGLTKEEAYAVLVEQIPKMVVYDQNVYPLEIEQTYQSLQDYLTGQYNISTGNILTDIANYLRRVSFSLQPPDLLSQEEIIPQLERIAQEINHEGKEAKIYYHAGQLLLEEGSLGERLDLEKTWEKLLASYGQEAVPVVIEKVEVHPSIKDLELVQNLLGDYTTYFDPLLKERANNVRLAAQAIDGTLLPPGGEFSFNNVVGEREPGKGYLPALVYQGNRMITDDGGGICQDSTTLYQAVKQANLEVLERHTHSLPVSYIPRGEDATVAYGVLDFRFRNDTQGYLLISATTGEGWIRMRIFGIADGKHPVLLEPDGYPVKPGDWLK